MSTIVALVYPMMIPIFYVNSFNVRKVVACIAGVGRSCRDVIYDFR